MENKSIDDVLDWIIAVCGDFLMSPHREDMKAMLLRGYLVELKPTLKKFKSPFSVVDEATD